MVYIHEKWRKPCSEPTRKVSRANASIRVREDNVHGVLDPNPVRIWMLPRVGIAARGSAKAPSSNSLMLSTRTKLTSSSQTRVLLE